MQAIYYPIMMCAVMGLLIMFILVALLTPFIEQWKYSKNEISAEEYQSLANMAQDYPLLKTWLAAQLKEKERFTGEDCYKIKYHMKQFIKQYELEAAEATQQKTKL